MPASSIVEGRAGLRNQPGAASRGVTCNGLAASRGFSFPSLDRAAHVEGNGKAGAMGSTQSPSTADTRGEQAATISREMVRLMRNVSGRGPTKARTTIGRDQVVVVFQETLTHGERVLVDNGYSDRVEALRQGYQAVLRGEAIAMIEDVLDQKVLGFMSTNHFDPDLAVEIFVLDPSQVSALDEPHEAEHEEHREVERHAAGEIQNP